MNTRKIGAAGEDAAARYLSKCGYKILERNFLTRHGEIDIIARDGEFVVFAEVKSRYSMQFGMPCEAVTPRKRQTIVRCAKLWLLKNNLYGAPVRFDVVEILDDQITLLKDAFRV